MGVQFGEFATGQFELTRFLQGDETAPPEEADREGATGEATVSSVAWGSKDPPDQTGHLTEVKSSGVLSIQTDTPSPVGEKIYLSFELPQGEDRGATRVRGIAKVARTADPVDSTLASMDVHLDSSSVDVDTIRRVLREFRSPQRHRSRKTRTPTVGPTGT